MKHYIFAVLILVAFGSSRTAAAPGETATNELSALQGTWTVLYSEQNGERRRDVEDVKKMRLSIKDDQWTLESNNNVKDISAATLKLDPTQNPKAVDLKVSVGLPAGETIPAIYELKGDELKFCFASESRQRPRKFDSREGSGGQWLLVLKREK
jgi:uncharacterized protein (TIGR03067 family)